MVSSWELKPANFTTWLNHKPNMSPPVDSMGLLMEYLCDQDIIVDAQHGSSLTCKQFHLLCSHQRHNHIGNFDFLRTWSGRL